MMMFMDCVKRFKGLYASKSPNEVLCHRVSPQNHEIARFWRKPGDLLQ